MENNNKKLWYIVQTYSGKENSVKDNLIQRISSMNMEELIFQVVIPEEIKVEKKADGSLKEKVVKIFPGYVFIEMIDNDESWFVVRNTPGVTGFLGSSGKKTRPVPVPKEEMDPILKSCGLLAPVVINYKQGDSVGILSGPFKGQVGVVESVDQEKLMIRVLVDMFGREIPIDVDYSQVEDKQ